MLDLVGGRKFVFGILLTVCSTAALFSGRCSYLEWSTFQAIVGGTYIIGNITDKAVKK